MTIDQSELTGDLHFAARKGDIKTVEALIDSGANIHFFDTESNSTLHHAVMSGSRQLVHWLIERDANVNSQNAGFAGETPITLAAKSGNFGITKLLLGLGADPYIGGWMQIDALDRAEMRKDAKGDKVKDLILRERPPAKERLEKRKNARNGKNKNNR